MGLLLPSPAQPIPPLIASYLEIFVKSSDILLNICKNALKLPKVKNQTTAISRI